MTYYMTYLHIACYRSKIRSYGILTLHTGTDKSNAYKIPLYIYTYFLKENAIKHEYSMRWKRKMEVWYLSNEHKVNRWDVKKVKAWEVVMQWREEFEQDIYWIRVRS